jgi:hypothetical protein
VLHQNTGQNKGTQILRTLLRVADFFQEAGQQLFERVYFELDPSQHARLATCLRLLASCLTASAAECCSASADFVESCGVLFPEMDTTLFVSPLVRHTMGPTTAADTGTAIPTAADIQVLLDTHYIAVQSDLDKRGYP